MARPALGAGGPEEETLMARYRFYEVLKVQPTKGDLKWQ
jgi:hypothetical protein